MHTHTHTGVVMSGEPPFLPSAPVLQRLGDKWKQLVQKDVPMLTRSQATGGSPSDRMDKAHRALQSHFLEPNNLQRVRNRGGSSCLVDSVIQVGRRVVVVMGVRERCFLACIAWFGIIRVSV